MIKFGIIGFSNKNGHPYSFSAIINGYVEKHFKKVGHNVILNYLKKQPKKNFLSNKLAVTKAWSKNYNQTKLLCKACNITEAVKDYRYLSQNIDAIIIAKDDWLENKKISKFFLNQKIPVFIDKPLTLNTLDLKFYRKYYNNNLLMSCSGLRFSNEISQIKKNIKKKGKPKLIIGNISNDVEKYAIHLIEVIQKLGYLNVIGIEKLDTNYQTYLLKLKGNINFILNCCGKNIKINNMTFFCQKGHFQINFNDNFNSFKNTLKAFSHLVSKKKQHVKFNDTSLIIKTIINIIKVKNQYKKKFIKL